MAVLGSRGGVGCTSIAVNLGATLAQQADHSVALVDLDLALGDADVALDLMADYTLADVALNIERLDMHVPAAVAEQAQLRPVAAAAPGADGGHQPHPRRVTAARHRSAAGQLYAPGPRSEQELLGDRRGRPAHGGCDPAGGAAGAEQPAQRGPHVQTLGNDEALSEKVKIVLNRVGGECDIRLKKAEETIGKPIFWQLPNDTQIDDGVAQSRRAAAAARTEEQAATELVGLAQELCGTANRSAGQRKGGAVGYCLRGDEINRFSPAPERKEGVCHGCHSRATTGLGDWYRSD